jgi:DNA-3-methyladenine glycosylase
MLDAAFFDQDSCALARALIGKVLRRRLHGRWLAARVVETEAYYTAEKGSHASLGRTPSREALFAPPGTIYMYHSRGGDSLNVSARGGGNAVLFKAAVPVQDNTTAPDAIADMLRRNPVRTTGVPRAPHRLCAGQTLLCTSLGLRIREWTGRSFEKGVFFVDDDGYAPAALIVARRLGIPAGRDDHLMYRYLDPAFVQSATEDPTRKRACVQGQDWWALGAGVADPNPTHGAPDAED